MEERDREAAVLRETPGADAEARVLVMTDGADELGLVVAGVRERTLVVYGFSVAGRTDFTAEKPDAETVFILDTLLRSAASFGEVNGADRIRTTFPGFPTTSSACAGSRRRVAHGSADVGARALYVRMGLWGMCVSPRPFFMQKIPNFHPYRLHFRAKMVK